MTSTTAATGGSGSIAGMQPLVLVVEDDPGVADITCRMVQAVSYRSECAASGRQALAMVANPWMIVDLLIIDLMLPDMPGFEVARQARQRYPGLPLIFTSGYPDAPAVPPEFDGAPFLQKPYTSVELAAGLDRLLPRRDPMTTGQPAAGGQRQPSPQA